MLPAVLLQVCVAKDAKPIPPPKVESDVCTKGGGFLVNNRCRCAATHVCTGAGCRTFAAGGKRSVAHWYAPTGCPACKCEWDPDKATPAPPPPATRAWATDRWTTATTPPPTTEPPKPPAAAATAATPTGAGTGAVVRATVSFALGVDCGEVDDVEASVKEALAMVTKASASVVAVTCGADGRVTLELASSTPAKAAAARAQLTAAVQVRAQDPQYPSVVNKRGGVPPLCAARLAGARTPRCCRGPSLGCG